jgi:hypothetical protein
MYCNADGENFNRFYDFLAPIAVEILFYGFVLRQAQHDKTIKKIATDSGK